MALFLSFFFNYSFYKLQHITTQTQSYTAQNIVKAGQINNHSIM